LHLRAQLVIGRALAMLLCGLRQRQGLRLHRLPAGLQRLYDDRLHNEQNVLLAGVVRSELGALAGVKAALKEGSEDGRLYVGPIQDGGGAQCAHIGGGQIERRNHRQRGRR
jgi:hypothetical protein